MNSRTLALTLMLALGLSACPSDREPATAVYAPPSSGEIFVLDPAGSALTQLTHSRVNDSCPTWSPDGRSIAFFSERDGTFGLFVMRSDGSGVRRLTKGVDCFPAWSPDGRRIAFARDMTISVRQSNRDIFVVNADGSGSKQLTTSPVDDIAPDWSPDGRHIAYSHNVRQGGFEPQPPRLRIYVMDADGSNRKAIPSGASGGAYPTWSPDGTRLAFVNPDSGRIYTMAADGSNVEEISGDGGGTDDSPAWSPVAPRIAFSSGSPGARDIYVMDTDGSARTKVTFDPADEAYPAWSPDGTRIAFVRLLAQR